MRVHAHGPLFNIRAAILLLVGITGSVLSLGRTLSVLVGTMGGSLSPGHTVYALLRYIVFCFVSCIYII